MLIVNSQAQFVNTNILIVIVHILVMYPTIPVYAKGAILSDAWFILLSTFTINPIMNIINPWLLLKCWNQRSLENKIKNNQAESITQAEAHLTMEYPMWDPAFVHAGLVKDFLTCVFFQPLFPVSGIIGMAAFLMMFWSQKYKLLRFSVRPITINNNIGQSCLYILSLAPLVWGVKFINQRFRA